MTTGGDAAPDPLAAIAALADDVGRFLALDSTAAALRSVVTTARLAFGAAACSIATVDDGELVYRVADGEGADAIVGTRLPVDRGIAGFAVASGQVLAIDDVQADRRFADDVATATGYVPTTLLVAPIDDGAGDVLGVVSILDRAPRANALDLAAAFATQAASTLAVERDLATLGRALLAALAASAPDRDLVDALLDAAAAGTAADDAAITALAGALGGLREAGPAAHDTALRLLADFAGYARRVRRR
jgi:hypothetical protein